MLIKTIVRSSIVAVSLGLLLMAPNAQAQPPKDTIHVAVTFYDFHPDGSNPEFEVNPGSGAGRHTGMVAANLNAQSKPVLGPTPYYNCKIDKWFKPWAAGDFKIPNYTNPAITTCGNPDSTVAYDTAFKNIVIDTFLVFTLVPGSAGTYQFIDQNFFPLDGKGFGNEVAAGAARTHNYSFTMEMHRQFKKVPNMSFIFTGDDDVWAFIDNTLRMDIGGIHNATTDSVILDNISGLTNGQSYMLDFFYCERHVTGSSIQITTNIITPQPVGLNLYSHPQVDTLPAGDSIFYSGTIVDDTGAVRPDFAALINWTLRPQGTQSSLTNAAGPGDTFVAITAYTRYYITATFTDPNNPAKVFRSTDSVWVKAGPPTRVVIESDTSAANPRVIDPVGSITLDSIINADTVYAILYDKYGNRYGLATSAAWSSKDPTVATVAPIQGKNYAGVIGRQTRDSDTTYVIATQGAFTPDTVRVILKRQETEIRSVCMMPSEKEDSVFIYFNGPVNWASSSIGPTTLFRKRPGPGTLTSFSDLKAGTPTRVSDEIIFVFPSGTFVAFSDSVTLRLPIAPNSRVFAANYCHPVPFVKELRVLPNPIILGENKIPATLKNPGDPDYGVRLETILANRFTGTTSNPGTTGSVTVFDAVGNVLFSSSSIRPDTKNDPTGKKLYIIWNLCNKKGTRVGGGTYLARFKLQEKNTGATWSGQANIGVKTKK